MVLSTVTPPTRDMMLLLQSDYLKVGGAEGKRAPYDMEDIRTHEARNRCRLGTNRRYRT